MSQIVKFSGAARSSLLTAALALTLACSTVGPSEHLTPRVADLGIGIDEDEVLAQLGQPLEIFDHADEELFDMGPTREFQFPGLKVSLCKPPSETTFRVWKFEVSSSAWHIEPNLSIGHSQEAVRRNLGAPDSVRESPEGTVWHYSIREFDGWLAATFVDDRLVSFVLAEDWS